MGLDLDGVFDTDLGEVRLVQAGMRITGTYGAQNGTLEGTLSGNILTGRWSQSGKSGSFRFTFAPDRSFTGQWSYNNDPNVDGRAWNGRRR